MADLRRRGGRRTAWIVGGMAVLLALAAAAFWAVQHQRDPSRVIRLNIGTRPPPLPQLKEGFLPVAPAKAEEINAGIALSTAPLERPRPFNLPVVTAANFAAHQSAVDCLTAAVYYEAASESQQGQRAVAQVVLNRVRHPAFPKSICGVVYQGSERRTGCQFSFTCDGSLARIPSRSGWDRARAVALAALAGYVEPSVGTATHYHAAYVVPYWAWSLDKVNVIGLHIFYRWRGYWGHRSAFNGAYAGEPVTGPQEFTPPGTVEGAQNTEVPSALPTGPRPLADELAALPSDAATLTQPEVRPVADEGNGSLVVDEKVGSTTPEQK